MNKTRSIAVDGRGHAERIGQGEDQIMNKNRSIAVGMLVMLVVAAVAAIGGCGGVAYRKYRQSPRQPPPGSIAAGEIEYATTNMFHLFRDAQYDYIHRHGGTMAKSVTELGDGFSIGSFGSLIHKEIWWARLDRPADSYVPESQQSKQERDILARPYRYAILPVRDCNSPALDARTTCVLAVPETFEYEPLLVLLAGPIRSDPGDFYRTYPIHKVSDEAARKAFRDAAEKGTPVNKAFLDRYLPEWNEPSVSKTISTFTNEN